MKKFITKINKKGQIKIPKHVRDKLGLEVNSLVELEFDKENKLLKFIKSSDILSLKSMIKDSGDNNALKVSGE